MKNIMRGVIVIALAVGFAGMTLIHAQKGVVSTLEKEKDVSADSETITLGAGCFWCVEAIFENLIGVESVVSGYSGGDMENPSYEEVCSGSTGHAEVVQVHYNPEIISLGEILDVFWRTHDPTTLNRQGADVGTQYRSAIFYHDDQQKAIAEKSREEMDKSDVWENPVVTEITPFRSFYKAEQYHQNYYEENPNQGYCRFVINPKLQKFKKEFKDKLKK